MKKMILLFGISLMFFSCKNFINEEQHAQNSKPKEIKIQRLTMDSGKYVDVTMKNVNAEVIDTTYFNSVIRSNYMSDNCNLKFDKGNNIVHVYVKKSQMKGYEGSSIECSFKYMLKSSGENCVYICPVKRSDVLCYIDEKPITLNKLPSFMFYIPLYGFGENRLEVSSIMKNEGALSCQTLWRY